MTLLPMPPPIHEIEERERRARDKLDANLKNRIASEIDLLLDNQQLELIIEVLTQFRDRRHSQCSRLNKKDLKRMMNALHSHLNALQTNIYKLPKELRSLIEESFEREACETLSFYMLGIDCMQLKVIVDELRSSPTLFEKTYLRTSRKRGQKSDPLVDDFIMRAAEIFSSFGLRPTVSFRDEDSQPRDSKFKKFLVALWEHCWKTPERWSQPSMKAPCKVSTMLGRAHSVALPEFRRRRARKSAS